MVNTGANRVERISLNMVKEISSLVRFYDLRCAPLKHVLTCQTNDKTDDLTYKSV